MTKYDRERELLRQVYVEAGFALVEPSDAPDFVLQRDRASPRFGVEVTDVFETESDARVRFHPRYVSQLLGGGPHMHRDDVDLLEVTTFTITGAAGELKAERVPGILRPAGTRAQLFDRIARRVRHKTELAKSYRKDVSHLNLIIGDRFDLHNDGVADDGLYCVTELLTSDLRLALIQSPFREVYVTSERADRAQQHRPLQLLLVLERFFLFCKACETFPGVDFRFEDVVPMFVYFHGRSDMQLALAWVEGAPCAMYRGVGVRVETDGFRIFDFHDGPLAPNVRMPPLALSPEMLAKFDRHRETFVAQNQFSAAVWMPPIGAEPQTAPPSH